MNNPNEDATNHILEKQLGKIGAASSRIGSVFTGNSIGASLAGRLGAEWAAKKLRTIDYKSTLLYERDAKTAIQHAYQLLSRMGKMIDASDHSDNPLLSALIGSGFGNMNPTIIGLEFIPVDSHSTEIHLYASAKEGLIKQKSAEKAVTRMMNLLRQQHA
ncbi:hypothetical protein [Cohnella cholangitidis]|uniref:Uncharacterized protein n=1 Tax=Cohnella cholangitidis TaxID=2598458 RepID=A0A7G5BSC6_9BACL|nr:hypothetical protein [Cohnella cholangitidis]QMV39860.1 hypothetical protein FPL14_00535 [Cohnella cholangitidis]